MKKYGMKNRKKAVSPVIATILMVAITVVLAGILYVMVMGLVHGPSSTPDSIGLIASYAPSVSSGVLSEVVSVTSASSGLTLGMVGFKVVSASGTPLTPIGISYNTATGGNAIFSGGVWTYTSPASSSTIISSGDTVTITYTVVTGSGPQANFNGYSLQAYGLSGTSVSGSADLQ